MAIERVWSKKISRGTLIVMKSINLICRNCSQDPIHVFRDCQNMYCTCPCVNQLRITGFLECTCGYMNKVYTSVGAGKWPTFFSDNCLCLKPSDHLPDFIRSVPKKIKKRKRGK